MALLKTHICHIRTKLSFARGAGGELRAVPQVGYKLLLASAERANPATPAAR